MNNRNIVLFFVSELLDIIQDITVDTLADARIISNATEEYKEHLKATSMLDKLHRIRKLVDRHINVYDKYVQRK